MLRFVQWLVLCLFVAACDDTVERLEKQTMDVHDIAMKNIPELNRLSRSLKSEVNKLAPADSLRKKEILQVLTLAERADEQMTEWMRQYRIPENASRAAKVKYLEEQLQLIEANQKEIEEALQRATAITR